MIRRAGWFGGAIAVSTLSSGPVLGQSHMGTEPLGKVDFGVSCAAPSRAEFDRGLALLHHMTYPRAREVFERVAELDPRCAMAHWGIAMTLFQPLWPTRPGPRDLARGWQAVETALSLASGDARERLLIAAAGAFFEDPSSSDYWLRIRRWERAMATAYRAFPDDDDVASLYALAHLATSPSDTTSSGHAGRAARPLLAILARNPDHPGAQHYLVHANDTPGRERESPEVIRRYQVTAPRNPHALHMPTHVYTRLGDWAAVIRGNELAAEAALASPAGDSGQFVWDEFPHAVEYLVYAHLQQGADSAASAELTRLRGTPDLQPTFKTAFHLASTRARYALERGAWREAMEIAPRQPAWLDWDRFTWAEAVGWFARGLGAARDAKPADAQEGVRRLQALETAAAASGEALFARNIRILRLEVEAWLAHIEGRRDTSVVLMQHAAELEVATPKHAVTPGPTLPAHELLGDLLLELKRPAEALEAYRRALELYPRRFNGLLGAARAARGAGDAVRAREYYDALLHVASEGGGRPGLAEARAFLAGKAEAYRD
jgi:tetratricopeptide (TPR) repeat protein